MEPKDVKNYYDKIAVQTAAEILDLASQSICHSFNLFAGAVDEIESVEAPKVVEIVRKFEIVNASLCEITKELKEIGKLDLNAEVPSDSEYHSKYSATVPNEEFANDIFTVFVEHDVSGADLVEGPDMGRVHRYLEKEKVERETFVKKILTLNNVFAVGFWKDTSVAEDDAEGCEIQFIRTDSKWAIMVDAYFYDEYPKLAELLTNVNERLADLFRNAMNQGGFLGI